jgi:hypothetical protein
MSSLDTILKRFDKPDDVREFDKGRLELITVVGDEPYVSLHLLGASHYAR